VVPGIAVPFYPMRPAEGRALSDPARAVELVLEFKGNGDTLQPKLNGDRAGVATVRASALSDADRSFFSPVVVDGIALLVQNRHGRRYHYKVANLPDFAKLPPGSCFDGEVYKGLFYPFEALAVGGTSYLRAGPDERARVAEEACRAVGAAWIFNPPTEAFLRHLSENLPFWEGIVRKQRGSPYVFCQNDTTASSTWWKHKWPAPPPHA
jgi:hypothetical protein